MVDENTIVWGRVAELGAFDGGARLRAQLVPEEDGPPIRLNLQSPPPDLAGAVVLGARVACRAYVRSTPEGNFRVAYWIDSVERREGRGRWLEVWRSPKPFVPRRPSEPSPEPTRAAPRRRDVPSERVAGGAIVRRRGSKEKLRPAPSALSVSPAVEDGLGKDGPGRDAPLPPQRLLSETSPPSPPARAEGEASSPGRRESAEPEKVVGLLTSLRLLPDMRTEGLLDPEDGGLPVELRLRRAPRGLLRTIAAGARVECLATSHANDPSRRFSSRVLRVELKDADGELREVWRHDPSLERHRKFKK